MEAPETCYQNLVNSVLANWRLQKRLQATLGYVEDKLLRNADMQENLKLLGTAENRAGVYTGQRSVDLPNVGRVKALALGPSRFWMAGGTVPKPNADTLELLEAYSFLPHTFVVRKWTAEEDARLAKIILQHAKESQQRDISQVEGIPTPEAVESLEVDQHDIMDVLSQLRQPESAAAVDNFGKEEWQAIAVHFSGMRGEAECSSRWRDCLKVGLVSGELNKEWTAEETSKLQELKLKYNSRQWLKIATELNTGRSPADCLARSQRQESNANQPWTEDEIQQLRLSYAKHAGKGSFWKTVAANLPNRSADQVMHFWRNKMDTTVRKGKWSPEEDEALKQAVKLFGKKWSRVAEAVPTRNQVQVRERWVNKLDPDLLCGQAWTKEEDSILVSALADCKNPDGTVRWADIARRLPGRTDDAVSNHFISMKKRIEKVGPDGKRKREDPAVLSEDGKLDSEGTQKANALRLRNTAKPQTKAPQSKKARLQTKGVLSSPSKAKSASKRIGAKAAGKKKANAKQESQSMAKIQSKPASAPAKTARRTKGGANQQDQNTADAKDLSASAQPGKARGRPAKSAGGPTRTIAKPSKSTKAVAAKPSRSKRTANATATAKPAGASGKVQQGRQKPAKNTGTQSE